MTTPDFLIVGAARSGTTALYYYLKQHPQLFLPEVKEPCFFTFADKKPDFIQGKFAFTVTDQSAYKALFSKAKANQLKGEVSTPYLFLHDISISNIYKYHHSPEQIKIIIILRNPIERAFSQYKWKVRDGRESLSFMDALTIEQERKQKNYSFDYFYAERGLYSEQIKHYLGKFKSVQILFYDDFKSNPENVLASICRFLSVDDSFNFKKVKDSNASSKPKSVLFSRMVSAESKLKFKLLKLLPASWRLTLKEKLIRINASDHDDIMTSEERNYLRNYYKEDLIKLQSLLDRQLPDWK